jgi:ankyrin repeat protein
VVPQALAVMTKSNRRQALQHRNTLGLTPLHYAAYIGSTAHALTILHHANASSISKTLLEAEVTGNHTHRGMTAEKVALARQNCAVATALGSTKPCPFTSSHERTLDIPESQGVDSKTRDGDGALNAVDPRLPSGDPEEGDWVTLDQGSRGPDGHFDLGQLTRADL